MPLPRYQPVRKRVKIAGPSLEDLDDGCLSRIIGHTLDKSKSREDEPYVGDNGLTERNLSLVSRRWYFLTQTQVSDHGVHKIDLEEALRRASINCMRPPGGRLAPTNLGLASGSSGPSRTPRRIGLHATLALTSSRTPGGGGGGGAGGRATSARKRLPYGVLSQRNLTVTNANSGGGGGGNANWQQATLVGGKPSNGSHAQRPAYDIKLFRAIYPRLLKYRHVHLAGSLTGDNFAKLLQALDSARVERLDLLQLRVTSARTCPLESLNNSRTIDNLRHLRTLTYTWTNNPLDEASNALLWTIYERAVNLNELQVYLIDDYHNITTLSGNNNFARLDGNNDSQRSTDSAQSAPESGASGAQLEGKLAPLATVRPHSRLARIVFERLLPANMEPGQHIPVINCEYSALIKRVLTQENSVAALNTNDCALAEYLIQASNRLCTRRELNQLRLTHPIRSLETLRRLAGLANLGSHLLAIVVDNFEQIAELRTALESFSQVRAHVTAAARCQLNLHLRDQKFPDNEEKVKHLVGLCRLVDVSVHVSALQRISIDCCHLMWSTGRALQAIGAEAPSRCIFRISLQTYPIRANTVNPCEITIPFGRCAQYKVSSVREDLVRHREIMKALKRDCYHQFVKSVRENSGA